MESPPPKTERNLTDFLKDVFGDMDQVELENIKAKIRDLGCYHLQDLQYVEGPDLVEVLKPIQRRKFLAEIRTLQMSIC